MIDVKSNQIQMLTKGQTGKNSDREPVVFSEFSLGAGSGDDSLGKAAPNDVTDDSAIADPGVLPLVGKAVAWIRLDNAPPQMTGNLNPILATYDKRPPAQPAVDADEQGGRKPPGPAKVGRIAVDLAATGRAEVPGHRETPGATLRSGRAQGRLDAIAPSRPSEIGPIFLAGKTISEGAPIATVTTGKAEKRATAVDPLSQPVQLPKTLDPGVRVVGPAVVARAPDTTIQDKRVADLSASPPTTLAGAQVLTGHATRMAPGTDSGPIAGFKPAPAVTADFNDPGDARNAEKPLVEGFATAPSDRRLPLAPAESPARLPASVGQAIDRAIDGSISAVTTGLSADAGSTPRRGVTGNNGATGETPNRDPARSAGPVDVSVWSRENLVGPGTGLKPAKTGLEIAKTVPGAVPQPQPLEIRTDPRRAGNEVTTAAKKSRRAPKTTTVEPRPDNASGQSATVARNGAGGLGLSVQMPGQTLAEDTGYAQLFDPKGENAFGAIEQRGGAHSLNGVALPAGAQPPSGVPRAVYQIAQAAAALKDRPVELSLNPEELGRVRLTLHSRDGNLTVNVTAERPETLVFLRRHIDQLATQLRDVGYQDLSFSFSDQKQQSGEGRFNPRQTAQNNSNFAPERENDRSPVRINLSNGAGVDIRL